MAVGCDTHLLFQEPALSEDAVVVMWLASVVMYPVNADHGLLDGVIYTVLISASYCCGVIANPPTLQS